MDEHESVAPQGSGAPWWLIGHALGWGVLAVMWANVLTGNRADQAEYGGGDWTDWLFVGLIMGPIAAYAVWAKLRGPKTGVSWGRHASFVAVMALWFASTFPGLAIANGAHVPGETDPMEPVEVFRLFAWEASRVVPLVDIPGTLAWERPVADNDTTTGVMMLVAKAMIVAVALTAVRDYWKRRAGSDSTLTDDVATFLRRVRRHRAVSRVWPLPSPDPTATQKDSEPPGGAWPAPAESDVPGSGSTVS